MVATGGSQHLKIVFELVDKATAKLKIIDKQLNGFVATTKRVSNSVNLMSKNMLNIGLGLTFFMFGIQLQLRAMLRRMFQVFEEANMGNSMLLEGFNEIRAALGAISIAFFDALSQSEIFKFIVDQVVNLANWFLNLSDRTRSLIAIGTVGFLGLIIVIGLVGQALLALYVTSMLFSGSTFFSGIASSLAAFGDNILDVSGHLKKFWALMSANPIAVLIALLLSLGVLFYALRVKFGSWGNAFKAYAATFIMAIALLFQFTIDGILNLVKMAAVAIINLIHLANKVPGINIDTSGLERFVTDFKVDIVGKVAEGLDRNGFNQQPVNNDSLGKILSDGIKDGFDAIRNAGGLPTPTQ